MDSKTIITRLGGPSEVARLCELTPQAVSQWYGKTAKGKDRNIPRSWKRYLSMLHPEVFGDGSKARSKPARERPQARRSEAKGRA